MILYPVSTPAVGPNVSNDPRWLSPLGIRNDLVRALLPSLGAVSVALALVLHVQLCFVSDRDSLSPFGQFSQWQYSPSPVLPFDARTLRAARRRLASAMRSIALKCLGVSRGWAKTQKADGRPMPLRKWRRGLRRIRRPNCPRPGERGGLSRLSRRRLVFTRHRFALTCQFVLSSVASCRQA